jgi:tRNA pseudouridine55 synthase
MDGFLNIDKPGGMTSYDVVSRVRRLLKTKRAGHAGTLDPDATGVLVVAVGQATRLLPYLPTEPKEYIARITFGIATDTEDASGRTTSEADASHLTSDQVQAVLPTFIGTIQQVPPMVSAVHHQGQRLYELARQGIEVERAARTVTIHSMLLSDFVGGERAEATLTVACGGGTYIRTLCKDIGEAVGLPAHMKALVRERVGNFQKRDAVALEQITPAATIPLEKALDLPCVTVSTEQAERLAHGMPVEATDKVTGNRVMLLYREQLLALARWENGAYHPFKVLRHEDG